MRLPDDPGKYSNNWKYIELARFNPATGKVSREMESAGVPRIYTWDDVDGYREKYKNLGLYTSVFNYNDRVLDRATRLGSLYFDLDSAEGEESRQEAVRIVDYVSDFIPEAAIQIYFTGKKGFHIEFEALALGVTGSNELPSIFRFIANDLRNVLSLETLDSQVYDLRRMWRLPNSLHQDTGLFKRLLSRDELSNDFDTIKEIAQTPNYYVVPEQEFSAKANEWYREYTYKVEQAKNPQKYSTEDILSKFNKSGTGMLKQVGSAEKEFDPENLFTNCSALAKLWQKAETKHHLEHEERLFLCSILTYTDEAVYYLHEILKNCSDYNFEKTQSHIDDWIRRREMDIGGRPFSCERANAAGVGCGNCDLEPKKKWVKIGDSWIESEETSKPSPIRFAYSKKSRIY